MPYEIKKLIDNKYKVVNKVTKDVKSYGTTKAKAERQVRLLNAIDHGFKLSKK